MIRAYYGPGDPENDTRAYIVGTQPSTQLTIAPNTSPTSRTFELQYAIDDMMNPTWIPFENHTQDGTVTIINLTDWRVTQTLLDPVTAYGGTVLVGLSGDYSSVPVQIWGHNSSSQEITMSAGVVVKGQHSPGFTELQALGFEGSVALTLPAYENNGWPADPVKRYLSSGTIVWYVQAYINGNWVLLGKKDNYVNQIPQTWFRFSLTETLDVAPRASSSWNFHIQGYWRNKENQSNLVRVRLVTDENNPNGSYLAEMQINPISDPFTLHPYSITISTNTTGRNRVIYMMFSLDGGLTWNSWYKGWLDNHQGNGMLVQSAN